MYTQLEQRGMPEPPVNVSTLRNMKAEGEPIACLTAYDASYALLVDVSGTDLVLVGDSLGMVIQGHDTTVPVTVNDVVYHTRAVARGLRCRPRCSRGAGEAVRRRAIVSRRTACDRDS